MITITNSTRSFLYLICATVFWNNFFIPDNRLIDQASQLKAENLKISVENEQLRTALSTGGGKDATGAQLAIAALEKKLLTQQEELTDLHKRKGENSQMIVDLNLSVEKQKKLIAEKDQMCELVPQFMIYLTNFITPLKV